MDVLRYNLDTLEGVDAFLKLLESDENGRYWADQLNALMFAGFPISHPSHLQLLNINTVLDRANPNKLNPWKATALLRACSSYKNLLPCWLPYRNRLWKALEDNPERRRIMRGLIADLVDRK